MGEKRTPGQSLRSTIGVERISLDVVIEWVDAQIGMLGIDVSAVVEAVGRVLAEPAIASDDIPSSDRAATDGIALRSEDSVGASTYNPLSFRLLPAGEPLMQFCAARVTAGESLPAGADAVVPLDQASLDAAGRCEIVEAVACGSRVARQGSHATLGSMLLPAGRPIRPYDLGLLISAGIAHLPTIRRPEVCVLLTGRDLGPGAWRGDHDANGPLLRTLIERDGGIRAELRRVDRDRTALRNALAAPGADIILVVGCTGRGPDDCARAALADAGELAIHGVALSPGESAGMGRTALGTPVFLLPGAPAACLWAYELLAGRAIRRLAGRNPALPFPAKEMRTRRKIISNIGLTEICPVRFRDRDSVEPMPSFAAMGLMAAAQADGFVIVPEGSEGFSEGASVMVYLLGEDAASPPNDLVPSHDRH